MLNRCACHLASNALLQSAQILIFKQTEFSERHLGINVFSDIQMVPADQMQLHLH